MRKIAQLTLLFIAVGCLAQSQARDTAQQSKPTSGSSDTGVVPLVRPYAIRPPHS